jgi:phosphoglycolate phosphatase
MLNYDLALFDFDGTLADSFPWFVGVMGEVADRFRFRRIDPSEHDAVRRLDAKQFLRHVGLPLWKVPLVAAHVRKLQAEQIASIAPFPGVHDLFRRLVECDIAVGVLTSNAEVNVRAVLGARASALVSHYDCDASLFGKARKIRSTLRRTGIDPSRAILIGDEARDIDAAHAAGIASGAVAWGYADVESLRARRPTEVFMTIEEIGQRLCKQDPASDLYRAPGER